VSTSPSYRLAGELLCMRELGDRDVCERLAVGVQLGSRNVGIKFLVLHWHRIVIFLKGGSDATCKWKIASIL